MNVVRHYYVSEYVQSFIVLTIPNALKYDIALYSTWGQLNSIGYLQRKIEQSFLVLNLESGWHTMLSYENFLFRYQGKLFFRIGIGFLRKRQSKKVESWSGQETGISERGCLKTGHFPEFPCVTQSFLCAHCGLTYWITQKNTEATQSNTEVKFTKKE